MMDWLWTMIDEQIKGNQFLSGGVVLMAVGCVVALLRKVPRMIWNWLIHRLFLEVEIPMRDDAFWWFDEWLAKHPYGQGRARWLTVRTVRRGRRLDAPPVIILSPAPGIHWLLWRGYLMIVNRERKDVSQDALSFNSPEREVFKIRVLTRKRAPILAMLEEARNIAIPTDSRLTVYTPGVWNNEWQGQSRCRNRPLSSVVLRRGVLEKLTNTVQTFIESESWYIERGIPYRYGCLLYGAPGSGKSSTILAIASHLKLDVAVLNLADSSMDDTKLRHLVSTVPRDCLLLIEDIDCAFSERKATDDKQSKVTFSGLLNSLDGVGAGEGRVLFLTSNHPELLDPALIRPGRCDDRVHLGNADHEQAERLFLEFFPGEHELASSFAAQIDDDEHSMAALQGHLVRHANDPVAASYFQSEQQVYQL